MHIHTRTRTHVKQSYCPSVFKDLRSSVRSMCSNLSRIWQLMELWHAVCEHCVPVNAITHYPLSQPAKAESLSLSLFHIPLRWGVLSHLADRCILLSFIILFWLYIKQLISNLPVKKSTHVITVIMKHAGMICSLHFAQFKVQQTELSAASQKYWCFYNLRKKTKTIEFNWLADVQTSHEGQLQLSFIYISSPALSQCRSLSVCCGQFRNNLLHMIYHLQMKSKWKWCVAKNVSIWTWSFIVIFHRS